MIFLILTTSCKFQSGRFFRITFHDFLQCEFMLTNNVTVKIIFICVYDAMADHDYASRMALISGLK